MKAKNRFVDPTKPLIDMSKRELRDAFDSIGLGNTFRMIEGARRGRGQVMQMAATVLVLPGGAERYIMVTNEYGDGEGTKNMRDLVGEIGRAPGILLDGESVTWRVFRVVPEFTHKSKAAGSGNSSVDGPSRLSDHPPGERG